jgi:hypothetical protein
VSRRITSDFFKKQTPEAPSNCFAIYGFDIFLDRKLKPFVIEVNRSPSFSCDSPLDRTIKYGVLLHAFKLLKLRPSAKAKIEARERQQSQRRLLGSAKKVVPPPSAQSERGGSSTSSHLGQAGSSQHARKQTSALAPTCAAARAEPQLGRRDRAELLREEESARVAYEAKHLGEYMRIFPLPAAEAERNKVYTSIIDESTRLYFAQAGTGTNIPRHKLPREASSALYAPEASVGASSWERPKSASLMGGHPIPPISRKREGKLVREASASSPRSTAGTSYRSSMTLKASEPSAQGCAAVTGGKLLLDADAECKG